MNRTKIEYLDFTWNPTVGCSGLDCAVRQNCWAKKQAKRKKHVCQDCYDFKPHYHWERIRQPLKVKKPSRIGVGFMGDMYDSGFGISMLQQIFSVMEEASQHTFLSLTKQSANMKVFLTNWQTVPENVWIGVSVNREQDLYRIEDLKEIDAPVKFVSFEPLYEDLSDADLSGIDWVVIGAQTRPTKYPSYDWVLSLLQKKIPVWLKNNLKPILGTDNPCQELPKLSEVFFAT